MDSPFFSILIPAFNAESFIESCIKSVEAQIFSDYELIIYNDGSLDGTSNVCHELASYYKNIGFYESNNEGLLMTRRKLLSLSRGQYILFLDSDDCLRNDALGVIHDYILRNNPDVTIFNASLTSDFLTTFRKKDYDYNSVYKEDRMVEIKEELVTTMNLNNLCFKVIKRDIYDIDSDYTHYKDVTSGEDVLQSLAVFDRASSVGFINDNLYFYRPSSSSMSHVFNINRFYSTKIVLKEIRKYIDIWELNQAVIEKYIARCLNSIYMQTKNIIFSNDSFSKKNEYFRVVISDDFVHELLPNVNYLPFGKEKIVLNILKLRAWFILDLVSLFRSK